MTTRYGKGATKRLDTSLSGILGSDQKDRKFAQRRVDEKAPIKKINKRAQEVNAANKQIQSQKIKQKALGEIENRNNLQKFQKYLTDRETRDQMSY